MRKATRSFALLLVFALALVGTSLAQTLTMGGGFSGGTFNDFVAGIADVVGERVPGVSVEPVASAGSVQNLFALRAAELDMAVAFAGDAYLMYNGFDVFDDEEQPRRDLRAIGFLYSAVSQVVTLADSGIDSFEKLVGKRIAVGELGSGTHLTIERLLRQAGLLGSVTLVYESGLAASESLQAGRVDAYHVLLGTPNATVRHTAATHDIVILDTLAVAIRSGLFDRYPFYTPIAIPAGAYRGVDADVPAFKDAGLWVVGADVDDDIVYEMTKAVYGPAGVARMTMATPVAREMGPSTALRGVAFAMHPGAVRYWQEVGLELPRVALP